MLEEILKAEARRLGFELVGITTPDPPAHLAVFSSWLQAGRHGEMDYLASQRSLLCRSDPRHILPECQSILVLGMRHAHPQGIDPQLQSTNHPEQGHAPSANPPPPPTDLPDAPSGPLGRMASYAWGEDYHLVLLPRLQALVAFLEDQVGHPLPNRYYTDTGPILERDLAQRAGLGWIGKNTCLINPQAGSYFLLAEILLGLSLTPDQAFLPDRCGSCQRCLDACPTQCILPDRTIDARRCISYLTIELKNSIPINMRPAIGDWVFGCDICQQVCPWNLRLAADEDRHPPIQDDFTPRPALPRPNLLQELYLTAEQFNRKFKGNPVKRAKRRGYLRNVAVALGNHGEANSLPALSHALLNDLEPLVRAHCAWALGEISGIEACDILIQAEQVEKEGSVLAEIRLALHKIAKS